MGQKVIKKNKKADLFKSELQRFILICRYYGVPVREVCGTLIRNFVDSNYDLAERLEYMAKKNGMIPNTDFAFSVLESVIQMLEG